MIPKIRAVGAVAVVTANADFNPLRQMKKLALELEATGFKGHVLFDLLAINGLAENRFVSIMFDGSRFDRSSFTLELNVNPFIKNEQDFLIKCDHAFLQGTVLSSREIEDFLKLTHASTAKPVAQR